MDLLVRRLLAQAQLFDDPEAYEAGVRDAIEVLTDELGDRSGEQERSAGTAAAVAV